MILGLFMFLPKAEAQPSSCEWLSIYCGGEFGTWEAWCVNVGGNTNVSCSCGTHEQCDNHES